MKAIAVALINFYQRYISPYKGFRCAHAALYKGDSCSQAVKKVVQEQGVFGGYRLIRTRLNDCKLAYSMLSDEREQDKNKRNRRHKKKWYDGCDPCAGCDYGRCLPKKDCDLPDLPCDCSLF